MDSWRHRVDTYCDLLEVHLDRLRGQLKRVRGAVMTDPSDIIIVQSNQLAKLVEELTPLLAQRQVLLEAFPRMSDDASSRPQSLRMALSLDPDPASNRLFQRCETLAVELRTVHQEVNALFLAEYTLAQTAGEILLLLTTGSAVYDPFDDRRNTLSSGRIFDRAA